MIELFIAGLSSVLQHAEDFSNSSHFFFFLQSKFDFIALQFLKTDACDCAAANRDLTEAAQSRVLHFECCVVCAGASASNVREETEKRVNVACKL